MKRLNASQPLLLMKETLHAPLGGANILQFLGHIHTQIDIYIYI